MNLPVSKKDYMNLSNAYDKHSRTLVEKKGDEYSLSGDFLAMENKIAGLLDGDPAFISLILASKHIASLFVTIQKTKVSEIDLKKWDERIRDGCSLLKIASAFVHATQKDFSLHLSKEETSS